MCIQIAPAAVKMMNKLINPVETKSNILAKTHTIIVINEAAAKLLPTVLASLKSILTKMTIKIAMITPAKNQLSTTVLTQVNISVEVVMSGFISYAILHLTAFQKSTYYCTRR